MKINIFKYIFFIILIFMIGIGIYILYKDEKKQNNKIENDEVEVNIINQLNIGVINFDTINPILSYNRDIQYIDKLIFNSLINITYDFKTENSLAKEFSKINPTTYIVKLKEDIYWHDGTKFTAKDVIFTIQNLKNDNIKSIYKENVKNIQEAKQIDDYTIKIILTEEVPFFEYMMCIPILASHGYDEETLNYKTTVPIGTGKYKIMEIKDDTIKIEKADFKSEAKILKINIIIKKSAKDLYTALIKNEIDFMITDNIKYEEYIGKMGYNVNNSINRNFEYLVLNNKRKILSDKKVRKAISYAIDRQNINYEIYKNKYNICDFPLDYGSYLFKVEDIFEYNINKSKSILIEDGWLYENNVWKKENNILALDLIVNQENENRMIVGEKIKKQLNEIGVIINIVKVDNNRYNNYIKNKNYDMILTGGIISNSPNLETYFGENNISNFYSKEIMSILKETNNIEDKEILKEKYLIMQQIYKEEVPFISLYFNSIFVLTNVDLKGDLSHNWYNLYYNIDNWYKSENKIK
ncbi:MAG: ABC transporter substrate-binding protein [Clostridia bacterium]|nr:ABC transporter substrate-binding protein [Clostridia bacterium]